MNLDNQPDLRLVDGDDTDPRAGARYSARAADDFGAGRAQRPRRGVIRETGLLSAEQVDDGPASAAGAGSFSRGAVDEGIASVARRGPPARRAVPAAARRPRRRRRRRRGGEDQLRCRCSSASARSRSPSDGSQLKVAITDPQDVRGLDELRLATRQSVEFFVAAKNDVLTEIRRLSRAAEAMNASFIGDIEGFDEDEGDNDLEADDGISDAPLVRLVNSLIFAAAEDGASDIHVEPQEEELDRPLPHRRRAARRPADPEAPRRRRDDAPEGAREARHRRAAQAAGRAHHPQRRGRRPPARHPRRDAADGRGRGRDDAPARQVARGADAGRARALGGDAGAAWARSSRGRPVRCS